MAKWPRSSVRFFLTSPNSLVLLTCSQRRALPVLDQSGSCSATGPVSRVSDSEQPACWPPRRSPQSAGDRQLLTSGYTTCSVCSVYEASRSAFRGSTSALKIGMGISRHFMIRFDSIRFLFWVQRIDSKANINASWCNHFFMYISMHDFL